MSEQTPNNNPEAREADYSSYAGIANDFFNRYVGDAIPEGVEDADAWRAKTRQEIADHMAGIAQDTPQEERVKAYADVIDGLKEMRNVMGGETVSEQNLTVAGDEPAGKSTMWQRMKNNLSSVASKAGMLTQTKYRNEKIVEFAAKNTQRKEDESDEAYEKRLKRRAYVVAGLGVAAAAATVVSTVYFFGNDSSPSPRGPETVPDAPDAPQPEAGYGESDYGDGNNLDIDAEPTQSYEQSIQAEREFLETNGRINNDFNNIDPNGSKEDIMAELHNQYTKSPSELSGQLYQVQLIEGQVDAIPDHLRVQQGESYDAYTLRLSEVLHHDTELHDNLIEYTTQYIDGKYEIEDMPPFYHAAYIDENGVTRWDTHVTSSDLNDKVIMLGEGRGIRLPCGQPVEFATSVATPPVGVGGAPVAPTVEYTPQLMAYTTPDISTPGIGGGPESTPGTPGIGDGPEPTPETDTPGAPVDPPTLAEKTGDFHADEGAPLAEAGPQEAPAQTATEPVFIDQTPGQAIPTEQLGGQIGDATQGTGGSRAEQGAGNAGGAAAAADLQQSHESAAPAAARIQNAPAPANPGTNTSNPWG